jgi:riboflavin kinase
MEPKTERGNSYLNQEVFLKGNIVTGNNRGQHFVNLPWVKEQIKTKLGFVPYIGTLNLKILNEKAIYQLRKAEGIKIEPEKGYYNGKCFKALVMNQVEGAVVLPDVPEYPSDLLEILAPVNLRKTLELKNGDIIDLVISIK